MKKTKKTGPILDSTTRMGIINRGEAAIRFIRAVKEYNSLYRASLSAVAFYLDIEQEKEAHEAYPLSLTGS